MQHQKTLILGLVLGIALGCAGWLSILQAQLGTMTGFEAHLGVALPRASSPHAPITINGNTQLTAFCTGNGTTGASWETAHVIENYEITGTGTGYGISIQNTNLYLIIRFCTVRHFSSCVYLYAAGYVRVENCTISDWTSTGFQAGSSYNPEVVNCTVGNGTGNSITAYDGSGASIRNNTIGNSTGRGIYLNGISYSYVRGNSVHNTSSSGIDLYDSGNSYVEHNYLVKAQLYVRYSDYCTVKSNTVLNSTSSGISLSSVSSSFILNNLARYCVTYAMEAYELEKSVITGNAFLESNIGMRIRVSWAGNTITKNRIAGNNLYNMQASEVHHQDIRQNVLAGAPVSSALFMQDSISNAIIDNTITGGSNGVFLSFSHDTRIIGNSITGTGTGISFYNASATVVSMNVVAGLGYGVYMVECADADIHDNTISNSIYGVYFAAPASIRNVIRGNEISFNSYGVYGTVADVSNTVVYNWIHNNSLYNVLTTCFVAGNYYYPKELHDTDSDGLTDAQENTIGTNVNLVDTDGDNFLDGFEDTMETNPLDPLSHPVLNQAEYETLVVSLAGNATLVEACILLLAGNWSAVVTMNDTIVANIAAIESALVALGDLSSIKDDLDGDGLSNLDELTNGTDPTMIDTDLDNLNDAFELKYGTDPLDDDTDNDGHFDGIELASGTDPVDPSDYPGSQHPGGVDIAMVAVVAGAIGAGAVVAVVVAMRARKKARA